MAILTGPEIIRLQAAGEIQIDPFDEKLVNPASYDVTLGDEIALYDGVGCLFDMEDRRYKTLKGGEAKPYVKRLGKNGHHILMPDMLCIAHVNERCVSPIHVTELWGKSSIARMGLTVHQTAGYAEPGFAGQFVLELRATVPIVLRAGLPIAQVVFHTVEGEVQGYAGRYQNSTGAVTVRA